MPDRDSGYNRVLWTTGIVTVIFGALAIGSFLVRNVSAGQPCNLALYGNWPEFLIPKKQGPNCVSVPCKDGAPCNFGYLEFKVGDCVYLQRPAKRIEIMWTSHEEPIGMVSWSWDVPGQMTTVWFFDFEGRDLAKTSVLRMQKKEQGKICRHDPTSTSEPIRVYSIKLK